MRAEQSRHHLVFAIYFMTDFVCRDTTLRTNSQLNIPKCMISAGQRSFAFRGEKGIQPQVLQEQQLHMQSRQQRNQLWSEDWRQTRLYNVDDALQHDHWLVNEAHNRRSVRGHQMDPLLNAVGPRFCRWSSLGLPYLPTHAGKDDPTQHLRTASWPEDQPKEDRSDAAERIQP